MSTKQLLVLHRSVLWNRYIYIYQSGKQLDVINHSISPVCTNILSSWVLSFHLFQRFLLNLKHLLMHSFIYIYTHFSTKSCKFNDKIHYLWSDTPIGRMTSFLCAFNKSLLKNISYDNAMAKVCLGLDTKHLGIGEWTALSHKINRIKLTNL